ncbi:MAG TPA: transposase [Saprospiraceae bacterium]|nr:transposase [Saprospiraceae bacterium]
MKQTNQNIQSPEEAKIAGLRDCFKEIGNLKFAALLFVSTCILSARSCNLYRAADFAGNQTSFRGNYGRLLRFFATGLGEGLLRGVFGAVLRLALGSGTACCMAMDRTDWQSGGTWRNLLVIGLSFRGYLVPLVWVDIGHRGNSDVETRLALLDRLAAWWPRSEVPLKSFPLVADREFGGEYWLLQIAKRGFAFVVRLKSNRQVHVWLNGGLRPKKAKLRVIRRYMQQKGLKSVEIVVADEYVCAIVCLPNTALRDNDPYIYLLTNLDEPQTAGEVYRLRWTIECCFGHLKSNGFNLEEQGFQREHQVEIIMAVLVLLYTVCLVGGILYEAEQEKLTRKIPFKKYANGKKYRQRSLFRTGLIKITTAIALLKNCLLNFVNELMYCLSEFYTKTKIVV